MPLSSTMCEIPPHTNMVAAPASMATSHHNRFVEVRIAAAPQILFRLGFITLGAGEPCQLEINLPEPSARGSFFNVVNTPLQLLLRSLSLMETVGKLRPDRPATQF